MGEAKRRSSNPHSNFELFARIFAEGSPMEAPPHIRRLWMHQANMNLVLGEGSSETPDDKLKFLDDLFGAAPFVVIVWNEAGAPLGIRYVLAKGAERLRAGFDPAHEPFHFVAFPAADRAMADRITACFGDGPRHSGPSRFQ